MDNNQQSSNKRILIAEDHALLREGLKALLAMDEQLEVVAEATDGREAIRIASEEHPDLILMDLSMPNTNGTEAIRAIKRRNPDTKIIVLTVHKTEEYVRTALQAGANGYALKDDTHQELISAIRRVLRGDTYLSPGVSAKIITSYLDQPGQNGTSTSWDVLTSREREILKLIAEGYKNKEIAEYLSLSLKTIEKHRSNLMKKLDLHSASALTAYAIENGLISK